MLGHALRIGPQLSGGSRLIAFQLALGGGLAEIASAMVPGRSLIRVAGDTA
jgi:hypothetical protein